MFEVSGSMNNYMSAVQQAFHTVGCRIEVTVDAGDGVVVPKAFERSEEIYMALQYICISDY